MKPRAAAGFQTTDLGTARVAILERLRARRPELEQRILARVYAVSDPAADEDSDHAQGLVAAVATALDYGFTAIELGLERAPPVPKELLAQARLGARRGVALETVLRRYFAGFALLGDLLVQESQEGGILQGSDLQGLMGLLSDLLDRLVAAVSDEHTRASHGGDSLEERRTAHVRRLLAGEFMDAADLSYDLEACHLGLLVAGPGSDQAVRKLAAAVDRRLLLIRPDQTVAWAWLGSRRELDADEVRERIASWWPPEVRLAIGEPADGLDGWRLTHRQARAAMPLAGRNPGTPVRYADVALLASILQDDLLVKSLRRLYLEPLSAGRGGESLRQTLRAYFGAERNASSAAAALGVGRHTVTNRLRVVEERIGRPLSECVAEIESALRIEELEDPRSSDRALAP